jgi:uncharacterized protein (TIGR02145 family)
MKKKINALFCTSIILSGLLLFILDSCRKENTTETVTDLDGNIYMTITIDTQVWMAENLKTTRFRNGDNIQNATDSSEWVNTSAGAYCDYDNTPLNSYFNGRLYNWYAVYDSRNLAPVGWHIPSNDEWATLAEYLGGNAIAGGKMKETGTVHWDDPNIGATNESGFTAIPGGSRDNGHFDYMGTVGAWWSATQFDTQTAYFLFLINDAYSFVQSKADKNYGCSVRCIKD